MDVSGATGAIAVGGKTNDPSLIGSSSIGMYYPFLLFYEPERLSRKWENYADLPTSDVISMGFSPNGDELFAFFQINCATIADCRNVMMLLQSIDGNALFQRRFTNKNQIKNYVGNYAYLDSNRRIV
jgi:hypothetical protein